MENNKLISEFMGGEKPERTSDLRHFIEEYHNYHTSWDWLIPVLNHIEMQCQGVPEELLDVSFYDDIDTVYRAVVEFIKEYNNN
jgi:hypothetical protein